MKKSSIKEGMKIVCLRVDNTGTAVLEDTGVVIHVGRHMVKVKLTVRNSILWVHHTTLVNRELIEGTR